MTVNAYPRLDNLGTNDKSKRLVPAPAIHRPQFLPKIFIMNDRGPVVSTPAPAETLISLYGDKLIDPSSPYFKHQNVLFPITYGNGGYAVVHRLVDPNNKNKANFTLYCDILEDDIKVYKRHSDGSILYDDDGEPVEDDDNSPFKGYRVKWIVEVDDGSKDLGQKTLKSGTMSDDDDNKSTMYPFYEFIASDVGSFYNNLAFALDAFDDTKLSREDMYKYKAFPMEFLFYEKENKYSTPIINKNIYSAPNDKFTLRPDAIDPVTRRKLNMTDIQKQYFREWDYATFEKPFSYDDNIVKVLSLIYEKEAQWRNTDLDTNEGTVNTDVWYDFTNELPDEDQKYLLNILTFRTLGRVPYFGFSHDTGDADLDDNQKDVTLSKNLPIYLENGEDGDISDSKYEELVRVEMKRYLDINGPYFNTAVNIETALVDTGFTLETKKSLANFITLRKNTFVIAGTHTFNKVGKTLTLEEERAVTVSLDTRFQLAPESTFYNTPVARAIIVTGSGIYSNLVEKLRFPSTIEVATNAVKMMGKESWDKTALFDRGELDIIKNLSNIEPAFIPEQVKQALWGANAVYPEPLDRGEYVFPAIQTVYPNDTSVLNNFFTVMAITHIYTIGYETQKRFSGNVTMNNSEFLSKIKAFMEGKLNGAFAGMFTIKVKPEITAMDAIKGYSWTVNVEIYSTVMKTVMTLSVESHRK